MIGSVVIYCFVFLFDAMCNGEPNKPNAKQCKEGAFYKPKVLQE